MDGFAEAINIKPMERHLGPIGPSFIMATHPIGKGKQLDIAPHPCGETHKAFAAARTFFMMTNIAVNPSRIRPIGLNRNHSEAMVFNQLSSDRRARIVKF